MPQMIGQGRRKRAASNSARSWVLSPISASATTPVDTKKASTEFPDEDGSDFPMTRTHPRPRLVLHVKGLVKPRPLEWRRVTNAMACGPSMLTFVMAAFQEKHGRRDYSPKTKATLASSTAGINPAQQPNTP